MIHAAGLGKEELAQEQAHHAEEVTESVIALAVTIRLVQVAFRAAPRLDQVFWLYRYI